MMNQTPNPRAANIFYSLLFVISARILLTFYWLSRFGGNWIEGDTARTTVTIQAVYNNGHLIPAQQFIYQNGFLYQVYVTALARISGWSIIELQAWIMPFIGILLTIAAFSFYLHILKKPYLACLATVLLSIQGDFIANTMRGSHEKIDYTLIFITLLVLSLSIIKGTSFKNRLALAVVYYLVILAENTTNVFFASTFTVTLILAFLLWAILKRIGMETMSASSRLFYVILMSMIFVFLVIFVFYPPARTVLLTSVSLAERIRLLFLSSMEPPAELYQFVDASWRIPYAWVFLRSYDIFLIILAGLEWLILLKKLRGANTTSLFDSDHFWLIILLPAFAYLNAAVILSDITGKIGQISNLQVRLIPLTVFVSAPLAAIFIEQIIFHVRASRRIRSVVFNSSILVITISVVLGLIKGTSEPLLSNVWLYYLPSETTAIHWLDNYIPLTQANQGKHAPKVWTGPDNRFGNFWQSAYWGPSLNSLPVTSNQNMLITYILVSPTVRLLTERYHQTLPDLRHTDLIYNNGDVQLYFRLLDLH